MARWFIQNKILSWVYSKTVTKRKMVKKIIFLLDNYVCKCVNFLLQRTQNENPTVSIPVAYN